jgi:hypothetical protein
MGFTQLEFLGLIGIASVFYFARRSFSDALSHMRGKDIKAMELYPALYKYVHVRLNDCLSVCPSVRLTVCLPA